MLLLAANVSGFSISQHYCGKRHQYTSLYGQKKKSSCCCNGLQKKKGCCKTKHEKMKVDDGKQIAKHPQVHLLLQACLLPERILLPEAVWSYHKPIQFVVPRIHPPPDIPSVRRHVLHGVFLI